MKTILHVASSSNLSSSASRQIGAVVIEGLRETYPDATLIERDLIRTPAPHITPEVLDAAFAGVADAPALALSDQLTDEVLSSDIIVLEAPMYNFSIPSVLKAWIDNIVRAGKTFAYTSAGPQGLAKGKKVILVIARGGIYSEGPALAVDHQAPYLHAILGFIGITDVEQILIEGTMQFPDQAEAILAAAKEQAAALSRKPLHGSGRVRPASSDADKGPRVDDDRPRVSRLIQAASASRRKKTSAFFLRHEMEPSTKQPSRSTGRLLT